MLLKDKVAVITGAASGMGRAMVSIFGAEGAQVVALDRDAEGLAQTVSEAAGAGPHGAIAVTADVSSAADVAAAFQRVADELGGAQILVNAAGIREIASPLEITFEEWRKVLGVNLDGVMLCAQAAARQMVARGDGGAIVNIASTASFSSYEDRPAYTASKTAVAGLTRSLARDLGRYGIRVNAISPGITKTQMTARWIDDDAVKEDLPLVVPLARYAEPEEMARPAVFLCSEMSSYITGVNLLVDGGHANLSLVNLRGPDASSPFSTPVSALD